MICFALALRSKGSTDKWECVVQDFNQTIKSIFNQTNSNFRVYVGCSEIPELYVDYDDRLIFIPCELPIPRTWEEKCRDRSWKLLECAKRIKKDFEKTLISGEGVYVFPVDADDFVNKKIAEYCHMYPNANGFKSKLGYRWVKGSRWFEKSPYFGGSMNIIKMYADDLPDELPDKKLCFDKQTAMNLTERYPIRWYDIEVERKYAALGKSFDVLPFYSTVYVLGTGYNISSFDPTNKSSRRFHPIAFVRKINPFTHTLVTKKRKEEFGIGDKYGF